MNSCELTLLITAIANSIADTRSVAELSLLAGVFVQIGDTLATIAAKRALDDEKLKGEE